MLSRETLPQGNGDRRFPLWRLLFLVTACVVIVALVARLPGPIWLRVAVSGYLMVVAGCVAFCRHVRPGGARPRIDLTRRARRHVLSRARRSGRRPPWVDRLSAVVIYSYLFLFAYSLPCLAIPRWSVLRDLWSDDAWAGISLRAMHHSIVLLLMGYVVLDFLARDPIYGARSRIPWIAYYFVGLLLVGLHCAVPPAKTPAELAAERARLWVLATGPETVVLDGEKLTLEQCVARLKARQKEAREAPVGPGDITILVSGSGTVSEFSRLLACLRKAGFENVVVYRFDWYPEACWELRVLDEAPPRTETGPSARRPSFLLDIRASARGSPGQISLDGKEHDYVPYRHYRPYEIWKVVGDKPACKPLRAASILVIKCDGELHDWYLLKAIEEFVISPDNSGPLVGYISVGPRDDVEETEPFEPIHLAVPRSPKFGVTPPWDRYE